MRNRLKICSNDRRIEGIAHIYVIYSPSFLVSSHFRARATAKSVDSVNFVYDVTREYGKAGIRNPEPEPETETETEPEPKN